MKKPFSFIVVLLLACTPLWSQDKYGELTVSLPETLNIVVRNETQAALIVVSEVPDLQFESTRRIFEVRPRGASEWQIYLNFNGLINLSHQLIWS